MPIIKSAIKRVRQDAKRYARNRDQKDALRTLNKQFKAALDSKDGKKLTELVPKLQSQIDTMVKKNIMHKNTAARKKSAIAAIAKANGGSKPSAAAKPAAKKPAAKKPAAKKPAAKKAPAKKPAKKK